MKSLVFLNGKADRVKFFHSLSASVYHPLLKSQVSPVILECKHEDSSHVEPFRNLLNHCFKEENKTFYDLIQSDGAQTWLKAILVDCNRFMESIS